MPDPDRATPSPVRQRPSGRPPAVAGQFYPADGAGLSRAIESCFTDPRGPGHLPTRHRSVDRRIRAAVVPHAGYVYSGPIAAMAYEAIARERPPATVLVLGVNHRERGAPAAVSDQDWTTPLGNFPVDHDLVRALARRPIERDEAAHAFEHSIEVHLPFLQYVLPRPQFAALSISMGPLAFLTDVAAIVQRALEGRDVLVVASTDFSHYVPVDAARRLDQLAIDQILGRSAPNLYEIVIDEEISMCGIAPTTVMLAALADEPLSVSLLRWGHSGEAEPMREVVGYASLLLRSEMPLPPRPAVGI
jgi:AmmeMemoRadiSam system protein B